MTAPAFIASRLRFKGRLPLLCIALSFFVIILAVAISGGFRYEIRRGVGAISGDLQIVPQKQSLFGEEVALERHPSWLEHVQNHPAVEEVVPVIDRIGIIRTTPTPAGEGGALTDSPAAPDMQGVLFKGMPGGADSSGCVRMPRQLAERLRLSEGEKITVYFIGEKTKARRFTIESLYESILDADDKMVVYLPLEDLQRVNGWTAEQVSSFEVQLKDAYKDPEGQQEAKGAVGSLLFLYTPEGETPVWCQSSADRYPQLFDWLTLIDSNVVFILILMVIVAGFNMISGLLILLFESTSAIGTFKAFGMRDRDIRKVYLRLSADIVFKGLVYGNAAALLLCALQDRFHLLKLDPVNYFVSFVPVHIQWPVLLTADLVAFAAIVLLLQLPCTFISKVDPAQTMRME
ncbi:MAG: ABC transporter permease [Bacteroidales bacterium]|nr:ABC transporter permease [Bacteroidales bacterium]